MNELILGLNDNGELAIYPESKQGCTLDVPLTVKFIIPPEWKAEHPPGDEFWYAPDSDDEFIADVWKCEKDGVYLCVNCYNTHNSIINKPCEFNEKLSTQQPFELKEDPDGILSIEENDYSHVSADLELFRGHWEFTVLVRNGKYVKEYGPVQIFMGEIISEGEERLLNYKEPLWPGEEYDTQ